MHRAALDSSMLVSAFLTPHGTSGQVPAAAERREFVLCLSQEIISETRRSLTTRARRIRRYYDYPDERIEDYAESLAVLAEMVSDLPEVRVVALDPEDDVIVATAVKAEADYLVSGDLTCWRWARMVALG
jgi:putative PIN family toxin of toxin-antitoxin system